MGKRFQDIKTKHQRQDRPSLARKPRSGDTTKVEKKEEDDIKEWTEITSKQSLFKKKTGVFSRMSPHTKYDAHILGNSVQPKGEIVEKRYALWSVAAVAVVVFLFAFIGLFAGATVTITPKQEKGFIEGTFTAYKDAQEEDLSFGMMILAQEESAEVPATREKLVEQKASGQIIIYNSYSNAPQRLIKNTRFETTEGLVYRIKDSIVVPGTVVDDGALVPGSIEVTVYADEPGSAYNIGLTDFTIPGFKDDPRYDNFYARSKSEMSNGFEGTVAVPENDDLNAAYTDLETSISSSLIEQARAQKPEGFVLYEDGLTVTFDEQTFLPEDQSSGKSVTLTHRGTLRGILFDEKELSQFIGQQTGISSKDDDVSILGIEKIKFSIIDKKNILVSDESIEFSLSGNVSVIWNIDTGKLTRSLIGKQKKAFQKILGDFPNISRAEAKLRPFWKRTFPEKTAKIKVNQVIEE